MPAVTADRCLMGQVDTFAEEMEVYNDLWNEQVAPRQDHRLMMRRLLYLASNKQYDQLMRDLTPASE